MNAAGRRNHGHTTADQVSHQRRQAIELALQPVVLESARGPLLPTADPLACPQLAEGDIRAWNTGAGTGG
jgi:hypothetical protein